MFKKKAIFFLIILMVVLTASMTLGKIIYVDDSAAGANDGSSWDDAYIYLQYALADANSTRTPTEIRVAQGTYKPDGGIVAIPEYDWRTLTFQLISGVSLKGSYAGAGSPDPNARNLELYETILSGDLNGDDAQVYNAQDMLDDVTRAENSYHVLTAYDIDPNATLDGFTITGGNADNEQGEQFSGGGIYCNNSALNITNCTFKYNSSIRYGGALCNNRHSELVVTNCEFYRNASSNGGALYHGPTNSNLTNCTLRENYAYSGGAIYIIRGEIQLTSCIFSYNSGTRGGGIFNTRSDVAKIVSCEFTGNYAENFGGGIFNRRGTTGQLFVGCIFKYNYAGRYGGGMYNEDDCSPVIRNCLFTGNSADDWGGALHFINCDAEVINCTIADNYAEKGGAICFGNEEDEVLPSDVKITNSIIWGNFYEIYNHDLSWMTMTYCCRETVSSRMPEGCFSEDPCFVMPGWDYHLKSQMGSYDDDSQSWFVDDVTSPCIDAGDPTVSVGDEPEPNGGRINMGAYGGTSQTSKSYIEE